VDDEARLQHQRMRDHHVMLGVGIFRDVEIVLNLPFLVEKKGPVRAKLLTHVVRRVPVVGGDGDKAREADDKLGMKADQLAVMMPILGAEGAARQHEHHRVVALQIRQPPLYLRVVGQHIIGEGFTRSDHGRQSENFSRDAALPKPGQPLSRSGKMPAFSSRIFCFLWGDIALSFY
jgi:hypothetical protein